MLKPAIHNFLRNLMQPRLLGLKTAIGLIVVIHLVAGAFLLRLEFNNAPELYFPKNSPAVILERQFRTEFPNDEILISLFAGSDLYSKEFLAALDRVSRRLEKLPDVDRVFSVTNVDHIAGSADGFTVERLIDLERLDDTTAEQRKARVLQDRFIPGWLASKDGSALALIVRTKKLGESRQRAAIEAALHEAVKAEKLEGKLVAVAGPVALDAAEMRSMMQDSIYFHPAGCVSGPGVAAMGRGAPPASHHRCRGHEHRDGQLCCADLGYGKALHIGHGHGSHTALRLHDS